MSLLRLYASIPSALHDHTTGVPHDQQPYDFDKLKWDYEISKEEGISRIEKKMYPFKEVGK